MTNLNATIKVEFPKEFTEQLEEVRKILIQQHEFNKSVMDAFEGLENNVRAMENRLDNLEENLDNLEETFVDLEDSHRELKELHHDLDNTTAEFITIVDSKIDLSDEEEEDELEELHRLLEEKEFKKGQKELEEAIKGFYADFFKAIGGKKNDK